jgi:hypothetical protein
VTATPGLPSIIQSFQERLDEVAERSAEAIWEAVPSYARLGEEFAADVRGAVRENVSILSEVLGDERDVQAKDLRAIEKVGARRAEAGIPLEDVLRAYRTVSRVCWSVLAEECRRLGNDGLEATIGLAEVLLRYTDQISTAVADAYARAQRTIVREQEGARREFLADLLYGTDVEPEELLTRAYTFGYDLSLSYIALVGVGPASAGRPEARVAAVASQAAPEATAEPIVLQKGGHTIALIPADATVDVLTLPEKMVAELGNEWRFGMGGPALGLEGIRRAYLEAREAFEIGTALDMPEAVFRFEDLLPYHFLKTDPALVDRFVEQTLGPLIAYDARRKGELIKTVEAFLDNNGSVKMAGQALFAHPHTISYRLRQVEKLTGWSIRDPEHKLRLQLAIRALQLARARVEPE